MKLPARFPSLNPKHDRSTRRKSENARHAFVRPFDKASDPRVLALKRMVA